MAKANGNARTVEHHICGWCAGAAMSTSVKHAHQRCYSPDNCPCECADNNHKLNTTTAAVMSRFCRADVDWIYSRHGQKRRVLSDERKEQLRAQLANAREKRS